MVDLLIFALGILGGAAILLPLLQLTKVGPPRLAGYVLAVALTVAFIFVATFTLYPTSVPWASSLLSPDQIGGIFALVTLGVTLAVTLASLDSGKISGNPVYYSLLSFTALGMVLLAYSQDLLMLFVAWELMSLP